MLNKSTKKIVQGTYSLPPPPPPQPANLPTCQPEKVKWNVKKISGIFLFIKETTNNTAILDNNLPLLYRELLDYFQDLMKFSEYDKNNDLILWNNRGSSLSVDCQSVFHLRSSFSRDLRNVMSFSHNSMPSTSSSSCSALFTITLHSKGWEKKLFRTSWLGCCFVNIYKSSKDDKLIQFFFKVVHRTVTTKKELLKYKLASDDKCPF